LTAEAAAGRHSIRTGGMEKRFGDDPGGFIKSGLSRLIFAETRAAQRNTADPGFPRHYIDKPGRRASFQSQKMV